MFCKYCGSGLGENVVFCSQCGNALRVQNSFAHWVPLTMSLVAFFIFFGLLGGDYATYEVNMFDWLALFTSAVALVLSFILVPKARLALRVASAIVSGVVAFVALGWIVL